MPDSDVIVCITAGLRRKPDESRLDLINRNVRSVHLRFSTSVQSRRAERWRDCLTSFRIPVDVLTYRRCGSAWVCSKFDRVIGLGTQLDTIRFRSLIAQHLKARANASLTLLILGEHGDSMVPMLEQRGHRRRNALGEAIRDGRYNECERQ